MNLVMTQKNTAMKIQLYSTILLNAIRKYTDKIIVINVLYEEFYSAQNNEFQDPKYYGIMLDYHLYDCFAGAGNADTVNMHIRDGPLIAEYSVYHPIFV